MSSTVICSPSTCCRGVSRCLAVEAADCTTRQYGCMKIDISEQKQFALSIFLELAFERFCFMIEDVKTFLKRQLNRKIFGFFTSFSLLQQHSTAAAAEVCRAALLPLNALLDPPHEVTDKATGCVSKCPFYWM